MTVPAPDEAGAAGVTGTVAPSSGEHGGLATLSSDSGLSYTNFKFVGWKIGSTIHSAGGSLVLTSNVTAEAQWTSTLFQLFYDLNGGSGTVPNPTTQALKETNLKNLYAGDPSFIDKLDTFDGKIKFNENIYKHRLTMIRFNNFII